MANELNSAFVLMGVGMITVFIVLLCVVIIGEFLIRFVNRFIPVAETNERPSDSTIPPSNIAVITSAVDLFTKGRGQITKIKKID